MRVLSLASVRRRRLGARAAMAATVIVAILAWFGGRMPDRDPGAPLVVRATVVERVVDGDTLVVGEERVRLHGIDAPELDQPQGPAARRALIELAAGQPVDCERLDTDRYGRAVAWCRTPDGTDLGGWLVARGLALAYRRYSDEYVDEETAARRARRGVWAGDFVPPWEWRRRG